jgi:Cd2+/Zn2+-exporting ATPase
MGNFTLEKFHLKNLDCASCAAKIERGLKNVNGISNATVDFANLTLYAKTDDIKRVIAAVQHIEPAVELILRKSKIETVDLAPVQPDYKPVREFGVLTAALVLFGILLFFENRFHAQHYTEIELAIVIAAYLLAGWNVIFGALRTVRKGFFFDENVLMVIATAGALAIHAYSEAVGVMIFYKIGELLQELAVSRSRRSIKSLLAARPDKAVVKTADGVDEVTPESVKIGDEIIVRPGEKVPPLLQANSSPYRLFPGRR